MIVRPLNLTFIIFLIFTTELFAQESSFTFAIVTDTHIGRGASEEALISSVSDINSNPEISFVLVPGDLTTKGSDTQLKKSRELLDKLVKKYYVIAGNHENGWSESGGTSFEKVFGYDRFNFIYDGYFFIGIDCGPLLRPGAAHIPKGHLVWLDSVLNEMPDKRMPVIFLNHIPLVNSAIDNGYEAIQRLKNYNTQLILCGHGHRNAEYDFAGIPGIMSRSNLPRKDQKGGYTIVTVANGLATFREKVPALDSLSPPWAKVDLKQIPKDSIRIYKPDYNANSIIKNIAVKWQYEHERDISGGFVITDDVLYSGTNDGYLLALKKSTGEKLWSFYVGGRIFSTPAVSGNRIIITSTDGHVYGISTKGKLLWKFKSDKPVVSSVAITDTRIFAGFSDGSFRCLDLETGNMIWEYDQIENGFVQSKPLLYSDKVYFGAWNSRFYALDQHSGEEVWTWTSKRGPAYSPASVSPVAVDDRIFIVAPDHFITCFDADTGEIIWREEKSDMPLWFSRGLSADSSTLFVKARNEKCFGISTSADSLKIVWQAPISLKDDVATATIYERDKIVYLPSETGNILAVSNETSEVLWDYKISNSTIKMILPVGKEIFASTEDGKIICLERQ